MREIIEPAPDEIEAYYKKLKAEAEKGGYLLNPDERFVKQLVRGLLVNTGRYGYPSCPCRIATGVREQDLDIECPCDYRDPDLAEFGTCYCALYVTGEVASGARPLRPIPERRPKKGAEKDRVEGGVKVQGEQGVGSLAYPVWRCRVCGYLCARNEPPEICPICRVKRDRFERFL